MFWCTEEVQQSSDRYRVLTAMAAVELTVLRRRCRVHRLAGLHAFWSDVFDYIEAASQSLCWCWTIEGSDETKSLWQLAASDHSGTARCPLVSTEAMYAYAGHDIPSGDLAFVVGRGVSDRGPLLVESVVWCAENDWTEAVPGCITTGDWCVAILQQSNGNILLALDCLAHELLDGLHTSFCLTVWFRICWAGDWLIDWSLTALSAQIGHIVPLEIIVCVLGNRNTLGVLYISYSVVDDQRHK